MNRVSSGTMTVVVFAILVGLGGAFLVRQQLKQPELPPLTELKTNPPEERIIVPVAGIDLKKGRALTLHDIVVHSLTPEQYAKSKFAGSQFMRDTRQLFGRTLNADLPKGSLFLPDNFYPEGFGPGVADRLQPGFRAVTVPIENVGAVHGFAAPGSVVDVLFRSEPEGERPEVTMTLLEGVEVLALNKNVLAGQRVDVDMQGTVTLSVTPPQAKVLKVVEGRGELTLTLRNPGDLLDSQGQTIARVGQTNSGFAAADSSMLISVNGVLHDAGERITLDDLIGVPTKPVRKQMQIYMAGAREVVEFQQPSSPKPVITQQPGRVSTPVAGGLRAPQVQGGIEQNLVR
ncbi:hypothetical protein KOR42_02360 [Thalassoglobus neptunius]|uniref:Flp pilus assembly protein RcpC/CpaB domain-containing protein n=1 Tax=Thalassoglobus neptunius TaxID=1938619 RepID=A0A5C5X3K0_9PLAN|nr:Flp pilus assembly protein CpaB [Thalassoglobus neptunius]TWT56881.1 hypothetical protein KOR42_02360 [Thalassoglobus neptunius]